MLEEKTETAGAEARERTAEARGSGGGTAPAGANGSAASLALAGGGARWLSERGRTRLFLTGLLGPTLLIVLAVVAFPFVYNVVLSLSNMNIYHLRDWEVIGLQQFAAVFSEGVFWSLLLKTLVWTGVNLAFHVGLGVLLAVLLNQAFVGWKPVWRVLFILPWALPQYITALTWRGMFNYEYGAINLVLTHYLSLPAVQWLTSPLEAFCAAILTNIWLGFPFMMVVALGGLQAIPQELYEAADVDGASAWAKFRHVTAPLLWPVMAPAVALGAVWTFNNINVLWLVTNGGEPNDQSHILVSYVYEAAFWQYRFGWAAALSLVIFALLFVFVQVFMKSSGADA